MPAKFPPVLARIRRPLSAAIGLRSALLSALLALAFPVAEAAAQTAGPAAAELLQGPRMVVVGRGSVTVVPDRVRITIGVVSQAATARDAIADNAKNASALIDEAVAAGVPRRDIATARLSLQPIMPAPKASSVSKAAAEPGVPKPLGFEVSNTVTIQFGPVEKAGEVVDRLIGKGANRIEGLSFEVSDAEKRLDGARRAAVEAARAKAELYAAAAGVRLGRILEIGEGAVSVPGPRPLATMRMAAAPTPIEAGETTLEAEVQLTFEILPGSAP